MSAGAPPRAAPLHRAVLAQAVMELRLTLRSAESLVVTLGLPLGVLIFFSVVDVLPSGSESAVDFLVPGVLAISVMSTAFVALAIQTAFERKYGVLKRLGGTPLSRSAFVLAKSLAVIVLLLVQTALVLVIARYGLDWQPGGGPEQAAMGEPTQVQVWLVVVAMALGAFTFTALGLLLAGAVRAEATLGLSNAIFLVLLGVSGVTIGLDELPDAMATVAVFTPSGALAQTLREALEPSDTQAWPFLLLVLAVWGIVATALAARTFRWEP